ncbi:hypothetical protein ACPESL_13920, partial [Psychrobacter pocilloporae]|uniref:hypothetical protein n=1 Tax=Psychrobacter pocilloporae TaxID=1775882 RepID=UPI003C2FE658
RTISFLCENLKINRSLFFLPLIYTQCSTRPNVIINRIQYSLKYNEDAKATIKSVGDTYSLMNSGNGSFSDFFIWREDFNERVEANKVLTKLRSDITSLIVSVDNNLLNSR